MSAKNAKYDGARASLGAMAERFSAVADPNRLKILSALFEGANACVSEIADRLDMSVATASHHLNILADAGIVAPEREGKRVCYALRRSRFVAQIERIVRPKRKY